MARNYRAEYQRRVERQTDMAQALGIRVTARQAAGHTKRGAPATRDVRDAYIIRSQDSTYEQQQKAAKRLQARWSKSRRDQIPRDLKRALSRRSVGVREVARPSRAPGPFESGGSPEAGGDFDVDMYCQVGGGEGYGAGIEYEDEAESDDWADVIYGGYA